MPCRLAWQHSVGAPIFSSPVVNSANLTVVVAAVNGNLVALSHVGECMWQRSLAAQVYAPLCLIPKTACDHDTGGECQDSNHQPAGSSVSKAASLVAQGGLHSSTPVPHHNMNRQGGVNCLSNAPSGATIVVGDAQGKLHAIDAASGQHLCLHSMRSTHSVQSSISTAATYVMHSTCDSAGSPGTGKGSQASAHQHTAAFPDSKSRADRGLLLVSCTNQGVLSVLDLSKHCADDVDDSCHTAYCQQLSDTSGSRMADPAVATAQLPGSCCTSCSCMAHLTVVSDQSPTVFMQIFGVLKQSAA